LKLLCPPDFRVFYGSFMAGLQGLAAGADGWISGFLNFLPDEAVALYEACRINPNLEQALQIWRRMALFVQLYFSPEHGQVSDLPLWRAGLELRGQHGGFSRAPLLPLSTEQRQDLADVMRQAGILPAQ